MSLAHLDVAEFVDRRTRALATVFLTTPPQGRGHDDDGFVGVSEVEPDLGLDLIAKLTTPNDDRVPIFGVILHGTTEPLPTRESATAWLNRAIGVARRSPRYAFPTVDLVYSMDNDLGYYAWRAEPILADSEGYVLAARTVAECVPAVGRRSLDEIVDRVTTWYDRFYEKFTM